MGILVKIPTYAGTVATLIFLPFVQVQQRGGFPGNLDSQSIIVKPQGFEGNVTVTCLEGSRRSDLHLLRAAYPLLSHLDNFDSVILADDSLSDVKMMTTIPLRGGGSVLESSKFSLYL